MLRSPLLYTHNNHCRPCTRGLFIRLVFPCRCSLSRLSGKQSFRRLFGRNLFLKILQLVRLRLPSRSSPALSKKIRRYQKGFSAFLVEVTGLEPTASWSRTKRATKLRYTSMTFCIIQHIYFFFNCLKPLFCNFIQNGASCLAPFFLISIIKSIPIHIV